MVKNRGDSKRPGKAELCEELSRELRHLRTLVRDAGENFILRREGEIEAAIGNLEMLSAAQLRALAAGLLQELHALKVKPVKGRCKDLREINRLTTGLEGRLAGVQEKKKRPAKK